MASRTFLRFPVMAEGAEYLVMGHLMRRNILTYKAPMNNEGYDLICIHPDPRHIPAPGALAQVQVQVKSRYATDSDRGFPVKSAAFAAFDFLEVAFLNVGKFHGAADGTTGEQEAELYTLPNAFVRAHHSVAGGWEKVHLRGLDADIAPYKGAAGFELIAQALGIPRPARPPNEPVPEDEE
jgi:hypothetical protein